MVCLCSLRSLKVPALQHSRRIRTDPTIQYMWVSGLLAKLRSKKVRKYSDFRQIQHEIRKFWLLCGDSVSTCYSNFWVPTPTTCSCIFYHVHAFSILSSDIATAPAFTDLRFAALAFEFPNTTRTIAALIQSCGFATTIILSLPIWLSPMLDWCLNTSSWFKCVGTFWEHSVSDQPRHVESACGPSALEGLHEPQISAKLWNL